MEELEIHWKVLIVKYQNNKTMICKYFYKISKIPL